MCEFYKEVYNEDIKRQFLAEIGLEKYPPRWWERAFEKTSVFETQNNKDLCNFTVAEALKFYKFLGLNSLSALSVFNLNLIKYGDWALQNELIMDGQNHFCEIDNELLATCIDTVKLGASIISHDDLLKHTSEFLNVRDKFLIYALFEGIKGKDYADIYNLKMSDINRKKKTVTLHSGRVIPVSDEFINVCEEAYDEREYHSTINRVFKYINNDSDVIFKFVTHTQGVKMAQLIYRNIIRAVKQLGFSKNITGNSITKSGMIYYLNQKAEELGISTKRLLNDSTYKEDRDMIFDKYNFNPANRFAFALQYENLLK